MRYTHSISDRIQEFLLLPPDFNGEVPAEYFSGRSQTFNGFAGFRAIAKNGGARRRGQGSRSD